jgi:hypothetical protein
MSDNNIVIFGYEVQHKLARATAPALALAPART